jgi:hypothetical protein
LYLATLILEEFVEKENAEVDADVSTLSISLHIHSLWNNSVIENWDHYKKAMEQLKKTMPNLSSVQPTGGHSFHPKNGVNIRVNKI